MIDPYYQDSHCTIYHGDCREILPELPKVDLVLTDPPYGIGYDKAQNKMADTKRLSNGGEWKRYEYTGWDKTRPSKNIFRWMCNNSDKQIIWGGQYFSDFLKPSGCWLIWNKIQRGFMTDGEMAWTNLKGSLKILDYSRADAYINDEIIKAHPTQKPFKLMRWCIELADNPQTILDPFMGSGTTLRAAKDLNRKCIGIELEKKYCDVAIERLKQETLPL